MLNKNNLHTLGFTLIELLIVVTVVGIIAALSVSTLNPGAQRERAEAGVRLANLEKILLGIEAYANIEGAYPVLATPGDPTSVAGVSTYIDNWPDGEPTNAQYNYWSDGTDFGVVAVKNVVAASLSDPPIIYKYHSQWDEIQICTDTSPNTTNC